MEGSPEPAPGAARHLAGFDGLRAIAVIAVMAYHYILLVPVFSEEHSFNVGLQLRVGVWIFFVVSGFLLYRPHAVAHAGGRPAPRVGSYAIARVLRIWPAYAVALAVLTYLWHRVQLDGAGSFLVHVTLTQNYFRGEYTRGIGPAWSLVVEVAFYAFLPFYAAALAWLVRRCDPWKAEVAGIVALVGFGLAFEVAVDAHKMFLALLPSFLPAFAVGMGLAVAVVHGRSRILPAVAARASLCLLGALAVLVVKALTGGIEGLEDGFRLQNQILYCVIAFLVVLPAVFGRSDSGYFRFLESRPISAVGRVSYGMFLWSVAVIGAVQFDWIPFEPKFHGRSAIVGIIAFVVTFAIAWLSWVLVEQPALRLKRVLRARPRSASDTPPVAAATVRAD